MIRVAQIPGARQRAWRDWLICLAIPLVVFALLATSGLSRRIDNAVYGAVGLSGPVIMSPRLMLIDLVVPTTAGEDPDIGRFRSRIAELLTAIASAERTPRVVVLDVWFSASREREREVLEAVRRLQARGVRVLAALNLLDRHGGLSADYRARHNSLLYEQGFDAAGHSLLEHRDGLLSYRSEIALPASADGASEVVPALPLLVVDADRPGAGQRVFSFERDVGAWQRRVVEEGTDAAAVLRTHPATAATHLIVGSFAADSDNVLSVPGPILLAYAVSEQLGGEPTAAPLNDPLATVMLAVLTCGVAAAVYFAGYRRIRRRYAPSKWARRAVVPLIVGSLAACAVLGMVFVIVMASERVPPFALPFGSALGMSAGLWLFTLRRQADAAIVSAMEQDVDEAAVDFDVFISYAHDPRENLDWVRRRVYAPIAALRHEDGRPLRVFFDQSSIVPGRQWKREIELALLGTRCFLPVYSTGYFVRAYCREEIELADQLRIEGRLRFVPVARSDAVVPERYLRKVQFLSETEPDFDERLLALVAAHATRRES